MTMGDWLQPRKLQGSAGASADASSHRSWASPSRCPWALSSVHAHVLGTELPNAPGQGTASHSCSEHSAEFCGPSPPPWPACLSPFPSVQLMGLGLAERRGQHRLGASWIPELRPKVAQTCRAGREQPLGDPPCSRFPYKGRGADAWFACVPSLTGLALSASCLL